MDHKHATQNNQISMKLPKVKLKTGQKGFYFLGAKIINALPPKARTIKYRRVVRKALDK